MKIPANETQVDCSKVKRTIWQLSGQGNKENAQSQFIIQRGMISQRTLKLDKTRIFKPNNTLNNKMNTRSSQNRAQNAAAQDENKLIKENSSSKPIQRSQKSSENVICVLGQLQEYEKIKINSSSKLFNSNSSRYTMDIEEDQDLYSNNNSNEKLLRSNSRKQQLQQVATRLPLTELKSNQNLSQSSKGSISNAFVAGQQSQLQQSLFTEQQQKQQQQNSIIEILQEDEDDEAERLLSEKFNQKTKTMERSLNNSIASTNLSSSSSTSLLQRMESHTKIINSNSSNNNINNKASNTLNNSNNFNKVNNNTQQTTATADSKENSLKKQTSLNGFQMNEYLDGYKVYKKGEKIFTFKIFKEDFLKIPTDFSKVITHSQDDDVSSDEDVVRGGIKFNYKSILKEIYTEQQLLSAPQLVLSNRLFA